MPYAAPRPCTSPGCGVLVRDGTSRCPKHPIAGRFADKSRGTRHERGYGSEWDKTRARILERDKRRCQPCMREGYVTAANIVDHDVPKAEGGTDDDGNLQAICPRCHKAKTGGEAARGRLRGGGGAKMFTSILPGPNV